MPFALPPLSLPIPTAARRLGGLLTLCLSLLLAAAGPSAASKERAKDITPRLKKVQSGYLDLLGQYPTTYTCELRLDDWVKSLKDDARYSWGKGYALATVNDGQLKSLRATHLREDRAEGLFNLALGFWQIRMNAEFGIIGKVQPTGLLDSLIEASQVFKGFEEERDRHLRITMRAPQPTDEVQEISLVINEEFAIVALLMKKLDGSSVQATTENVRAPTDPKKWLLSDIDATIREATGKETRFKASFTYMGAGDQRQFAVYKEVTVARLDAAGKPILDAKDDVNPITYEFDEYRVAKAPPKDAPRPPVGKVDDIWNLVK